MHSFPNKLAFFAFVRTQDYLLNVDSLLRTFLKPMTLQIM